jgi:hypothetical protein
VPPHGHGAPRDGQPQQDVHARQAPMPSGPAQVRFSHPS